MIIKPKHLFKKALKYVFFLIIFVVSIMLIGLIILYSSHPNYNDLFIYRNTIVKNIHNDCLNSLKSLKISTIHDYPDTLIMAHYFDSDSKDDYDIAVHLHNDSTTVKMWVKGFVNDPHFSFWKYWRFGLLANQLAKKIDGYL